MNLQPSNDMTIMIIVRSYGVVLWEMVTYASQPYPGKSNEEVLKFVVDGGVMEKPQDAPQEL